MQSFVVGNHSFNLSLYKSRMAIFYFAMVVL